MKINLKKSLKLVTLLITSILIAAVSAQVYSYMYIDGSVTIGTAKMIWLEGENAPGDTTISGGTVTIDLDIQPGINQNFTECLFLKNNDTASHNLTMTVTTNVSTSTFEWFNTYIYENATVPGVWTYVDTLTMTTQSDSYSTYTGNTPLDSGEYYRLSFDVKAKTGTSGTVNFDIEVRYE